VGCRGSRCDDDRRAGRWQWRKVYTVHRHRLRAVRPDTSGKTGPDASGMAQEASGREQHDGAGALVVVPGTSFARGVKVLLPQDAVATHGEHSRGQRVEEEEKEKQGRCESQSLMTLLVPTWYGVSLSQSDDWGGSWGPPSPFLPHGRHKESVLVSSHNMGSTMQASRLPPRVPPHAESSLPPTCDVCWA
jgi:hypothetical protein